MKVERGFFVNKDCLTELIESSPDMITVADYEGNIILTNRRTRDLLGYLAEELTSLTFDNGQSGGRFVSP